jgi:hypothetical protein
MMFPIGLWAHRGEVLDQQIVDGRRFADVDAHARNVGLFLGPAIKALQGQLSGKHGSANYLQCESS